MKYSYSPKYPLEISEKIYINRKIGQVFSVNHCEVVGIEIPIESLYPVALTQLYLNTSLKASLSVKKQSPPINR